MSIHSNLADRKEIFTKLHTQNVIYTDLIEQLSRSQAVKHNFVILVGTILVMTKRFRRDDRCGNDNIVVRSKSGLVLTI